MKKKVVVATVVSSLMLASAGAGAFAASNLESIKAYLNLGVKFTVDGKNWAPTDSSGKRVYPITYNNTTYLPIRSAGEALGVPIQWDAAKNTVHLGNGASSGSNSNSGADTGTPTSAGTTGFSYNDAAPINKVVSFQQDERDYSYTADMYVSEVIRGEQAKKKLLEHDRYNYTPDANSEYILFKVNFKLTGITGATKHTLREFDFDLVTSGGEEFYQHQLINEPDPKIEAELSSGQSKAGWIAFLIDKGDNPVLAYGQDSYEEGGVYFKLSK